MAVRFSGEYLGDLRTTVKHESSGAALITDAPVDNGGQGRSFSPTDLLGVSLVSCIATLVGLAATKNGWRLPKFAFEASKEMQANPRRVKRIAIQVDLPSELSQEQRAVLIEAGEGCPVAHSLHPDVEVEIDWR